MRHPVRDHADDGGDGDPQCSDAGDAPHDLGVSSDAVEGHGGQDTSAPSEASVSVRGRSGRCARSADSPRPRRHGSRPWTAGPPEGRHGTWRTQPLERPARAGHAAARSPSRARRAPRAPGCSFACIEAPRSEGRRVTPSPPGRDGCWWRHGPRRRSATGVRRCAAGAAGAADLTQVALVAQPLQVGAGDAVRLEVARAQDTQAAGQLQGSLGGIHGVTERIPQPVSSNVP